MSPLQTRIFNKSFRNDNKNMKTKEEIEDRINMVYDAMKDCDNHNFHTEASKLEIKLESLKWVLE